VTKEDPRFTILLAVRDRADLLKKCLESLAPVLPESTGQLLIVCDGGDPAVRDAAGELPSPAGWTTDWMNVPAGGPARARNAALPWARGQLILFLNDDVRVEPGLLRAHDRLHQARPGHAVMGNTRWAPEVINSEFMHWVAHHDSFYYLIPDEMSATWEYFHTMNVSVDRAWFDDGARFDESFPDPAFEDTELGYRLWNKGLRISLAYDAVLYHVHNFTLDQYIAKSRMRGASARRFTNLYPELRDRIISEYEQHARRLQGMRGKLKSKLRRYSELEMWEARVAEAFLGGYRGQ
jgi:GT2 family glycosyltransferase